MTAPCSSTHAMRSVTLLVTSASRHTTQTLRLLKSQYLRHHRYASAITDAKASSFDHVTDVLVVGSGAAALTAAARSRSLQMDTLVVEKTDKIGGTTSYSGGGVWVPCNHLQAQNGISDSPRDAETYINSIVKEGAPASTPARRAAYLEFSPEMAKFLDDQGFKWNLDLPYPDYHALEPGASVTSRSISPAPFDLRTLSNKWQSHLRTPTDWQPVMTSVEARSLFRFGASIGDFLKAVQLVALRPLWAIMRGKKLVAAGVGLIAQLLHINLCLGTQFWTDAGLDRLLMTPAGDVVGALIERDGKLLRVQAKRGVILAAGGFSRNPEMRERFLQQPTQAEWSLTAPEDKGDAIRAATDVGADMALMKHAWWMPCLMDNGKPMLDVYARSFPHSIIVDQSGRRYFNESECYCDAGNNMLARNGEMPSIHSWEILDSRHRRRYMLGRLLPGFTPRKSIMSRFLYKDSSLSGLAKQIGVDEHQLQETVERFNKFALDGVDQDFQRGLNPYNKMFSDPSHGPNPNLGTIEKGPFYAVKIYPGDIGTKGGLVTDERARVLNKQGQLIKGLYATGNTTASVFGSRYPGSGGTLGPGMTFGYVAATDMARQ
ncbi:FAD-binding-2 domain-containing protein [Fusarium keratoplasticum]|nr:FAD-binding-2 domain-containing protein [Fusarium keratoplasticum]